VKKAIFILLPFFIFQHAFTQTVGIGTTTPDASARLDVSSSSQGILIPRLSSAQRSAIVNPAIGLLVFQTDGATGFCYYNGFTWTNLTHGYPLNSQGVSTSYGLTTTLAGSGSIGAADGAGPAASLGAPTGVAVDVPGNVYVADQYNNKIRKITPAGVVTTLAGSGSPGAADGEGAAASFNWPAGVAVDGSGNVYVADQNNNKIRKITPAGVVSTFAGSGAQGHINGPGTVASFTSPSGLALDASGYLYVADAGSYMIRKITPAGAVTTLAGNIYGGSADGAGGAASFNYPTGVATDALGNVYVADRFNNKIRKITAAGVVTTVAGSGLQGAADGAGAAASFFYPTGVAIDASGNIYVTDMYNNNIRKITPAGVVTTLAGSSTYGAADGAGTSASFNYPEGLAVDASGKVYVADTFNNKVREIIAY
jgi:sugar lactone lactonase YvrE